MNKNNLMILSLIVCFGVFIGAVTNARAIVTPGSIKNISQLVQARLQENVTIQTIVNVSNYTTITQKPTIIWRIDDWSMSKNDQQSLSNAAILAYKYNIAFDLAVITQQFNNSRSFDTLNIYYQNRDRFRIIAHGYTHENPIDKTSGEFFDRSNNVKVPFDVQEQHIKSMKDIMLSNNLMDKIDWMYLPGSSADNNTFFLLQKYGYNLTTVYPLPIDKYAPPEEMYNGVWYDNSWVSIPQVIRPLTKDELNQALKDFNNMKSRNPKYIFIVIHIQNFREQQWIEPLIKELKQ